METNGEGNDLEERYISVRRGGKRQAPPAKKPQGRSRRGYEDDEFYDDPYYDDYDRGAAPAIVPVPPSARANAPAPPWGGCAAGSIAWWWCCRP